MQHLANLLKHIIDSITERNVGR